MTEPRPCPRRNCNGQLRLAEQGNLNGVDVEYWDCDQPDCDFSVRETTANHDEPTLDI